MKIYLHEILDHVLINQNIKIYVLGHQGRFVKNYSGKYPYVSGYPDNAIVKNIYSYDDSLCIECNLI